MRKDKKMNNKLDEVLLLLLIGIYFVLDFFATGFIPDMIFGVILIYYHFKFLFIRKKQV